MKFNVLEPVHCRVFTDLTHLIYVYIHISIFFLILNKLAESENQVKRVTVIQPSVTPQ